MTPTLDQFRAGYVRNARGLRSMLAKAESTGRKYHGYTAEQLRASVTEYERISTLTDADLLAHLRKARS